MDPSTDAEEEMEGSGRKVGTGDEGGEKKGEELCGNWCEGGACDKCEAACFHDCKDDCIKKVKRCNYSCKRDYCNDCDRCYHDCKVTCPNFKVKQGQDWRKGKKGQHASVMGRERDAVGSRRSSSRLFTRQHDNSDATAFGTADGGGGSGGARAGIGIGGSSAVNPRATRVSLSPPSGRAAAPPPDNDNDDGIGVPSCMRCYERDHPDDYAARYAPTEPEEGDVYDDSQITNSNKIITMADAEAAFGIVIPTHAKISYKERKDNAKELPKSKRKSVSKHILEPMCRELIRRVVPGASKNNMILEVGSDLVRSIGGGDSAAGNGDAKEFDKLMGAAVGVYNNASKGSIEKRTARAILYVGQKGATRTATKVKYNYTMSKEFETIASQDYASISTDGGVQVTSYSRSRTTDEVVKKAVEFLLDKKNVSPLSWGMKNVKLAKDETVTLPKLTRHRSRDGIWRSYMKHTEGDSGRVGRSTFYRLMKVITSREEKMMTSVDYVVGILVNEPIEIMQSIVDDFTSGQKKEDLTEYLAVARNFLKNQYDDHAVMDDGDAFHGVQFSLEKPSGDSKAADSRDCPGCKFPFYVCNLLKEAVETTEETSEGNSSNERVVESALLRISDSRAKFRLFMEHRCRVVNQRMSKDEHVKDMVQQCHQLSMSCVAITIDWKMRYEGRSARETSQEFYGKRHMGWHGGLCDFFNWGDTEYNGDDGPSIEKGPVRYHYQFDQILSEENKQDSPAVFATLEALLIQLHESILPVVPESRADDPIEVTFQSDNAGCYQSRLLKILIAILNVKFAGKILISRYFHSETQDGKEIIDAGFGQASNHTMKYMKCRNANKIRKIKTPAGLALALSWGGGVRNHVFQLVRLDRKRLSELCSLLKKTADKLGEYYHRANDVFYFAPVTTAGDSDDMLDIARNLKFDMGVQAYSGVDRRVKFSIDVGAGKVQIDEEGQEEIDRMLAALPPGEDEEDQPEAQQEDAQNEDEDGDDDGTQQPAIDPNINIDTLLSHFEYDDGSSSAREASAWVCQECNYANALGGSRCRRCKAVSSEDSNESDEEYQPDEDDNDQKSDDDAIVHLSDLEYDSDASDDEDNEIFFDDNDPNRGYLVPDSDKYTSAKTVSGIEVLRYNKFNFERDMKHRGFNLKQRVKRKNKKLAMPTAPSSSSSSKKRTAASRVTEGKRKDVLARAVRFANEMTTSTGSSNGPIIDGKQDHPLYEKCNSFTIKDEEKTRRGWARRKDRGDGGMYGAKFIGPYRDDIRVWFDDGEKEKSKKKTPGGMREELCKKYPDARYTIPGEIEIRTEISKLIDERKNKAKNKGKRNAREATTPLPNWVSEELESVVGRDYKAKPNAILNELENKLKMANGGTLPDDYPSGEDGVKKMKNKIQALKSKRKKDAVASVLDS